MAKTKTSEKTTVETPATEPKSTAKSKPPVPVAETQIAASPVIATVESNRRTEKVGIVVSTKMQKTIVVEIEMRKAHPKYKRVMKSNKKFYAHDEQNSARTGDVVRIREARPLSKLKRWSLEEIVRRSSLSEPVSAAPAAKAAK
jgi:small subunit ribosomal protein S17